MWKVKRPSNTKAISYLKKALTYKNGKPKYDLSSVETITIRNYYKEYELARGIANPKLECYNLNAALLLALESAYSEVQKAGRLSNLRARLLLNATTCPFCGLLPANTLDHHLPKSVYQIFAVYSSNLVPLCGICNNIKSASTGLIPSKRFVHVYYDDIPDHAQFLRAKISLLKRSLKVNIVIAKIPELTPQLYDQLTFQIEKIDLNKRLSKAINDHLMSLAISIKSTYEAGGSFALKLLLTGSADHLKQNLGLNHWLQVVLAALAENDEFCNGGFYEPLSLLRP